MLKCGFPLVDWVSESVYAVVLWFFVVLFVFCYLKIHLNCFVVVYSIVDDDVKLVVMMLRRFKKKTILNFLSLIEAIYDWCSPLIQWLIFFFFSFLFSFKFIILLCLFGCCFCFLLNSHTEKQSTRTPCMNHDDNRLNIVCMCVCVCMIQEAAIKLLDKIIWQRQRTCFFSFRTS